MKNVATAVKIRAQMLRFTASSGITVSAEARRLITLVLEAMQNDPHRLWHDLDRERVLRLRSEILSDLPAVLRQIAQAEHAERRLTAFDVLHWLQRNLLSWCPVDK